MPHPIAMKSTTLDAYYRAEVLYAQVQEILHLDDHEGSSDDAKAALEVADLLLAVGQAECILKDPDASEDGGPLGFTSTMLRRSVGLVDDRAARHHVEAARHAMLPRVEEKLRDQCSDLCEVVLPELVDRARAAQNDPSTSLITPSSLGRQAMEIPALILELQTAKRRRKAQVEQLKKHLHAQLLNDLSRIKAVIITIQRILVQYKQQDAPRVLRAKMEWLVAYSNAMAVRAKVLARQVQVETYPRDRMAVLSNLHDALEERRRRALEGLEQLQAKLHLYRSADSEYQAIAREYASVLQGIEEKRKWIRSLNM